MDVFVRDYLFLEFVFASKMGFLQGFSGAMEGEINGKTIMGRIICAKLSSSCGFMRIGCSGRICVRISTSLALPKTTYNSYFVFSFSFDDGFIVILFYVLNNLVK